MKIAVIGSGSVGRALGAGFSAHGHDVVFGVREPASERHADLPAVEIADTAAAGADLVVVAVPAAAVVGLVPSLGVLAGQVVVDATNAVGMPVPGGFASMGELVCSLLDSGVRVVKAFNTVGAEHLTDGCTADVRRVFLPIAGDVDGVDLVTPLAAQMGFDVVSVGGRDQFELLESHAKLWIHLAFRCGWGRDFAFTVARS